MSHGSTIPAVLNSFSSDPWLKNARKRHGRLSAPLIHHCKSTMWTTSLRTQRLWMCWLMGQDLTHTPSQAPGNARYDRCPPKIHFHYEAWEVNFLTICREKYFFSPLLLSVFLGYGSKGQCMVTCFAICWVCSVPCDYPALVLNHAVLLLKYDSN